MTPEERDLVLTLETEAWATNDVTLATAATMIRRVTDQRDAALALGERLAGELDARMTEAERVSKLYGEALDRLSPSNRP